MTTQKQRALVTGASSGIGREIARELSKRNIDLILVARREDRLKELKEELSSKVEVSIFALDLQEIDNIYSLKRQLEDVRIDILINNAGFGLFGEFKNLSLEEEINMIHLNIRSMHIIMKLFLEDMIKQNSGYILNVASLAAFCPGPFMASYYATKAYVLRLGLGVLKELEKSKINVHIASLCPGPVSTEFGQRAGAKFGLSTGATAEHTAKYAVKQLFKREKVIVPTFIMKFSKLLCDILPNVIITSVVYKLSSKLISKI